MKVYAKALDGSSEIFWGLAPVIRESSKEYWETKNNIKFPDDFVCSMDWNKRFAREVLELSKTEGFHVYFCPITVDVVDYLAGIL